MFDWLTNERPQNQEQLAKSRAAAKNVIANNFSTKYGVKSDLLKGLSTSQITSLDSSADMYKNEKFMTPKKLQSRLVQDIKRNYKEPVTKYVPATAEKVVGNTPALVKEVITPSSTAGNKNKVLSQKAVVVNAKEPTLLSGDELVEYNTHMKNMGLVRASNTPTAMYVGNGLSSAGITTREAEADMIRKLEDPRAINKAAYEAGLSKALAEQKEANRYSLVGREDYDMGTIDKFMYDQRKLAEAKANYESMYSIK